MSFRTIEINQEIGDFSEIAKNQKKNISKLVYSAMNRYGQSIKSEIAGSVSREKKIPKRILMKKTSKTVYANNSNQRLVLYFNYSKIRMSDFGKFMQVKKGTRAGRFYQEGAFVQNVNGKRNIFERKTNSRYPIRLVYLSAMDSVDRQLAARKIGYENNVKNFVKQELLRRLSL